jgi:hypothetical protein
MVNLETEADEFVLGQAAKLCDSTWRDIKVLSTAWATPVALPP